MSHLVRWRGRSERVGILALGLIAGALVACGEPAPKVDPTKVFLDVVDMNAKAPPPQTEPPKVGKLQVFSVPVGGTCRITRFRGRDEVARELSYVSDAPRRTIIMTFGRTLRLWPALALEIVATQGDGVTNMTETVIAGFGPDSSVKFGTRSFSSTGREVASEKVQLSELDKIAAVKFARQLMDLCPDALR
jgi:hypothetical protein